MAKKSPEQRIAALTAELARAKEQARKHRTRRLIQAGASFESFLSEWEALSDTQRHRMAEQIGVKVRELVRGNQAQGEAPAQP